MIWITVNTNGDGGRETITYIDLVHANVSNTAIFQILTQAANGNAVASTAGNILDVDVVGAGLDSDAVISALVDEVGELDVGSVHGIWIRVLVRT